MNASHPTTGSAQTVYITGFLLEEESGLSLQDICRVCAAQSVEIIELVHEGVLHPGGESDSDWQFTGVHVHRAQRALRLQRDLGVNLPGVALALQLMDEMEHLRARLQAMG